MRSRTDSRSDKAGPATLEKHFEEIVVGSGRSQEPYIIAFHYASDNVSGSSLGTLFGFFEVDIHDQDAAYIVNFLASVAKKEYFANPHRSPVESFEVALHKINVALAEIVKHGNVSWLGHLHGAIGSISQNTLHFSVTGEGELYLAREEALRSISVGLADTNNEPHPLKTFTEVSSGELFDADIVFAFSPAVWSLFSPDDLRRSLNRLGPAGFEQFLRTALVNELPIAAVAVVTCSAPAIPEPEETPKETRKSAVSLSNVWSGKPFDEALQKRKSPETPKETPVSVETPREAYTDKKTGHIYVQASTEETFTGGENPWKERWMLLQHGLETKMRGWSIASRKASRRIGKESTLAFGAVGAQISLLQRSLGRKTRSLKRTFEENREAKRHAREETERIRAAETALRPPEVTPKPEVHTPVDPIMYEAPARVSSDASAPLTSSSERVRRFFQREARPEITLGTETKERLKELRDRLPRLRLAFDTSIPVISSVTRNLGDRIRRAALFLSAWLAGSWRTLSPREKWSIIGVMGAIATVGVIAVVRTGTEVPTPQSVQPALEANVAVPIFPPTDEPLATLLTESRLIFPGNNSRSVALVDINDTPFLITERSIVNLQTQESTTTPEIIRLATAMDDLDAVFILGESGSLYLWRTVTKKFETNTLPLPVGAQVTAIGSYLTYLYVLDREAGAIYRFPRAEGGFGTAATWSKESVTVDAKAPFAVYENILLGDTASKPALYTRGRNTSISFAGPLAPLVLDALTFDTRSGDVLALDRTNKRIIRWSITGTLIAQYYHESFADTETFTVPPDGTEVLTSRQGATEAWRIR